MPFTVLIRGGGDLASGIAIRLFRVGWNVIITELPQPLAVRRLVSFAQAVYDGQIDVEEVHSRLISSPQQADELLRQRILPVLVDPGCETRHYFRPDVLLDARMIKRAPDLGMTEAPLVIGLGPGFVAQENCHAVIETMRGPTLGRVYWQGKAESDTGLPESVANHQADRVLRAPASGVLQNQAVIGSRVKAGQILCTVDGAALSAPFDGYLRGLLQNGLAVTQGMKIGDLDPRLLDERLVHLVSDKALALGGAALEAILSAPALRPRLKEAFTP